MRKLHRVPLSPRAVEILTEAQRLSNGSGLVFPGQSKGRPLADMTLSKLVKQLGFDATVLQLPAEASDPRGLQD